MYKAIGEAAYNDGLFSQAAPIQKYQASVSQFGDGAIGAIAKVARRYPTGKPPSSHSLLQAVNSGSLGRTFLPAFGARAMRGLGHAYRDGSLGDTVSVSLPGVTTAPSAPAPWKPDLASIGLGVMAGGLLFYLVKL